MTNVEQLKSEIVEWHKKALPECTFEGELLKLDEELSELIADQRAGRIEQSHEELADVYIVSLVLAKRYKSNIGKYFVGLIEEHPAPHLLDNVSRKLEINKKRSWHMVNGVFRHKERSENE